MNIEQATELTDRCMSVILSCNTVNQLDVAVKYSNLVYRKLGREIELIKNTKFISLLERSIGFAQCKVKYNAKYI